MKKKNSLIAVFLIGLGIIILLTDIQVIYAYFNHEEIIFKMESKNIIAYKEQALFMYIVEMVISLMIITLGITFIGKDNKTLEEK